MTDGGSMTITDQATERPDVTVSRCIIDDCSWVRRYNPPERPEPAGSSLLDRPGAAEVAATRARLDWLTQQEDDLREHLVRDHTVSDWVNTIRRQHGDLVRAEDLVTELRRHVRAFDQHMEREHGQATSRPEATPA